MLRKLRMALRGRSSFLSSMLIGTAVLVAVYYAWNNFFVNPSSKIRYSSVQGFKSNQLQHLENRREFVIEQPPVGQEANENWKKAKALQDRIDEERIIEEQAAGKHGKAIDTVLKARNNQKNDGGQHGEDASRPLLFKESDELDGDYFTKLERIVHLDLKGAPPLVSYLEKLFPLLKTMGATGVLMEYEDMFPYSGNLSLLASNNAYSRSDLQRIQTAAKDNQLEIIPLVQTFGHMEFILKYKQFMGLREHDYTPQVITPVKRESYSLIFNILDQVLKAHPDSRRIHLGCDEVYGLGEGESNRYITSQRITAKDLFLQHVVKVARHVKQNFPSLQPLIWDDWLRSISYDTLASSGLPQLVEPVIWYYQHNIRESIPPSVWEKYSQLFTGLWVASAFKGATGSDQLLTNSTVHLDNNLQWVDIIRHYGVQAKKIQFRGVVLTGWQRYDHFATLCELLPVSLPSLSLSMQAVKNGAFGSTELGLASSLLRCSNELDLEFPSLTGNGARVTQDCRFPGSDVFYGVQQVWGIMELYQRDLGLQSRISGWMTDYQVRHGISNPGQIKVLVRKLEKTIGRLNESVKPLQDSMLQVYDASTIEEWITTNIKDRVAHLQELLNKGRRLLERKTWPARPFTLPSAATSHKEEAVSQTQGGAGHGQVVGQRVVVSQGSLSAKRQVASNAGAIGPHNVPQLNRVDQHKQAGNGQQYSRSHNVGAQQGGPLSQTLLKKTEQGAQGRPSGPSKMQNYGPRQQPVYAQAGLAQKQKPSLRQYMPALSQKQQNLDTVQHTGQKAGSSQFGQGQQQRQVQGGGNNPQRQGQIQNLPAQSQHQLVYRQRYRQGLVNQQQPQGLLSQQQSQQGLLNQQRSQQEFQNQQERKKKAEIYHVGDKPNQHQPANAQGPQKLMNLSLRQPQGPAAGQQNVGQRGSNKMAQAYGNDRHQIIHKDDKDPEGKEADKYLDPFLGHRNRGFQLKTA